MTTPSESDLRAQAAINEMKAHIDYLMNRCINMAAELTVLTAKVKELEGKQNA